MAEALRAALRLLPVVKSSPSPIPFGACSRASAVRRSNTRASENQQPVLLSLPLPNQQQQQALPSEKNLQSVTGLARFARAVLAYVGVGVSAVAANQLAGPSIVHGRYFVFFLSVMWKVLCYFYHNRLISFVVNYDVTLSRRFRRRSLMV